jgi:carboxylate-amine ligase
VTPDARYYQLADRLRDTVVRGVTFGLHVQVGVASGDTAIQVMAGLLNDLPLLLALSANSPFWDGRWTGHHAHRVELLEGLPTGGLPPRMRSWCDYLALVKNMRAAGFIASPRDLWWDVRPSAANGTVEVRICDMPPDLPSVLALTALIQCLVHRRSAETRRVAPESDCQSLLVRQNRWRACRYGLEAEVVDPGTLQAVPVRQAIKRLVGDLRDAAVELGCVDYLESARLAASLPSGSVRQLALFEQTGDLAEVVRTLVDEGTCVPSRESAHSQAMDSWLLEDIARPRLLQPPCGNGGHADPRPQRGSAHASLRPRLASG